MTKINNIFLSALQSCLHLFFSHGIDIISYVQQAFQILWN